MKKIFKKSMKNKKTDSENYKNFFVPINRYQEEPLGCDIVTLPD